MCPDPTPRKPLATRLLCHRKVTGRKYAKMGWGSESFLSCFSMSSMSWTNSMVPFTHYTAIACMINTQSEEYTDFFSAYKSVLKHRKSDKTWWWLSSLQTFGRESHNLASKHRLMDKLANSIRSWATCLLYYLWSASSMPNGNLGAVEKIKTYVGGRKESWLA